MYYCDFINGKPANQSEPLESDFSSDTFGSIKDPINILSKTEAMNLADKYLSPVISLLNDNGIDITFADLGVSFN